MKSHFRFNKQERSGIFFLLLLIIGLQGIYFLIKTSAVNQSPKFLVDNSGQIYLDSLKNQALQKHTFKIYPFNPNFISDYKGYTLGVSPSELDKMYAFRKQGSYVNSAKEFQKVTQISDSLLDEIAPYFKFPKWANTSKTSQTKRQKSNIKEVAIRDLNVATAEDLKSIYGIGDKLSRRIVKFRDRLGGFLVDDQLLDVYGLEPEVIQKVLKKFRVLQPPELTQLNINEATVEELSRLIYINYGLAQEIVGFRETNGPFQSLDQLGLVETFPKERIDRIKLYLTLKN